MKRRAPRFWIRSDQTGTALARRLELDAAQGRARRRSLRVHSSVSVLQGKRVVETWKRGEALA